MVSPEVTNEIRQVLKAIEAEEDVRILYAVESGSRAWGFSSVDSDFDPRLIYIRRPEWYLSINVDDKRDVIEKQCPGDIDLSGWDIRKALKLYYKSNPPLLEWLDSPIVYRDDCGFAAEMRQLLGEFYSPTACIYHYLRMARNSIDTYCRGDRVKHKKYFYVLRPLLAARWIKEDRGPVPMVFETLLVTIADRPELVAAIRELHARKTAGGELGEGPRIEAIYEFALTEPSRLETMAVELKKGHGDVERLNELFRRMLTVAWNQS